MVRSFLDIGCGESRITKLLKHDVHYTGVDCNRVLIKNLQKRFKMTGYRFVLADLEKEEIPLEHQFNSILMLAFIEHVNNPVNVIKECARLLADNGLLVITTPTPLGDKLLRILISITNPFSNSQVERPHEHLYDKEQMRKLFETSGLIITRYRKFDFGANQIYIAQKERIKTNGNIEKNESRFN